MGTEDFPCRRLEWDSRHFGVSVAQLDGERFTDSELGCAAAWADANAIDCLYWLTNEDVAATGLAPKHGFEAVDRRVTLRAPLEPGVAEAEGVRLFRTADLPLLEAIAAASHHDSRFYRDLRFDREKADEMYRIWLRRSCDGWAREVLVAETDGVPAGYCSWHDEGDGTARIGLIAVAEAWRGRGLGRRLIETTLARCRDAGFQSISVRTQGTNAAAQALYQACGFGPELVQVWFHRWKERKQ